MHEERVLRDDRLDLFAAFGVEDPQAALWRLARRLAHGARQADLALVGAQERLVRLGLHGANCRAVLPVLEDRHPAHLGLLRQPGAAP